MDYTFLLRLGIGLIFLILSVLNLYLAYKRPESYRTSKIIKPKHIKILYILVFLMGILFIILALTNF